ncbi:hypothetical protein SASPL_108098 [Salvia splendens]|uniref:RING-type domain-containing protein n=1 Tax=Salvia splendens TaxID=180675 RepID=A0A8X8YE38_SALSN|nr:hypothetical protein SASPL_108098 [Salvia splendens]
MSNEIQQDTSGNTSARSDEIWHAASDDIQQTFTCEICIEPAMLSEKFGHDANCVHNICFMCNVATTKCVCPACKRLVCYACRAPWHAWFRCSEASQVMDENDILFNVGQSFAMHVVHKLVDMCKRIPLLDLCCELATTKCACPACKRLVCYACRVSWHVGFRYSEASQVMDENDVQFGLLLEEMEWKRCPKRWLNFSAARPPTTPRRQASDDDKASRFPMRLRRQEHFMMSDSPFSPLDFPFASRIPLFTH